MNINSIGMLMAVMLCATITSAQSDEQHKENASRVYVRIGAGYGFSYAGQTEMNGAAISGSETIAGNTYNVARKRASFGSGVSANIAGGYMITQHFGLELGIHAVVAPEKYSYTGSVPGFSGSRVYTSETYAKLPVYIIPALVLSTGNKLRLYSRAGLVLPVSDKMTQQETRTGTGQGQTTEVFTREITNRFSIGLQGAVGVAYALSRHLSLWGEVSAISRNAYTKRQELTGYTENGMNGLGTFTTNQIVTEYEFSYDVTDPVSATEPDKQPAFSVPFGSIGMSVGIKYAF